MGTSSLPSLAMGPSSSKYDAAPDTWASAPTCAAAAAAPVPSAEKVRATPSFSAASRGGGAGYSAAAVRLSTLF
jgi:hypothetical protein